MGGGGKGGTTTQSVSIPPEVLARYNAVNARAEGVAARPFQQYGTTAEAFVAPLTSTQQAGIAGTNVAAGMAQPFYGAATGLTMGGAQGVGPLTQQQIGYYQNPFTQSVVDPTVKALQQEFGQQRAQQQASAIRSGAFGGDRSGLERANLMRQQGLGMAQAIAPLYAQGYQTGVQTAAGQQGVIASDLQRQLAAGQQLAGLGTGAQAAALQGAQAQLGAGQIQQQTEQAGKAALYNQFLQEQGYPFQVAQFLANIAMGTGALSGSTTTTTQPGGFFSDRRLKEDIKKVGETFDGQPIYTYKYKGEDTTRMGLMAQDVEKHHPEAVGKSQGYKTVDYDKATANSEGGAVTPERSGLGFAAGGSAGFDQDMIRELLKSQQQQYGMYGAPGTPMGAQGTPGGAGRVPQASLPVGKLATPAAPPRQQESGLSQGLQTGKNIAGLASGAKEAKRDFFGGVDDKGKYQKGLFQSQERYTEAAGKHASEQAAQARAVEDARKKYESTPVKDVKVEGAPRADLGIEAPTQMAEGLGAAAEPATAVAEALPKEELLSLFAARGGRIGYEEGGDVEEPISSYKTPGLGIDIPDEQKKNELMTAKSAPTGGGGGGFGVGDAVKVAATVLPMIFSDKRMKENIVPIGKTYDGQTVYKYNYKGEPESQIGLIAQEVEKRRPGAVHEIDGMKAVDYARAVRNKKASGGSEGMDPSLPSDMSTPLSEEERSRPFETYASPAPETSPMAAIEEAARARAAALKPSETAAGRFFDPDPELYRLNEIKRLRQERGLPPEEPRPVGQDMARSAIVGLPGSPERAAIESNPVPSVFEVTQPGQIGEAMATQTSAINAALGLANGKEGTAGQQAAPAAGLGVIPSAAAAPAAPASEPAPEPAAGLAPAAPAPVAEASAAAPAPTGGLAPAPAPAAPAAAPAAEQPRTRPPEALRGEPKAPGTAQFAIPQGYDPDRAARAKSLIESSNRYDAIGPDVQRKGFVDRAYGKYQVMGENIPAWTKRWYGQALSPQEFLANPDAQEAVFKGEFGSYIKKYGNVADAASMWHSGLPFEQAVAAGRRDVNMTTADYVRKFVNAYNGVDGERTSAGPGEAEAKKGLGVITAEQKRERDRPFEAIFGRNLPEALKSERFIVPLLGGLGAMLASNKFNFGQALGEGIMGGVGAYTDMYSRVPQTEQTQAATTGIETDTYLKSFKSTPYGNFVFLADGTPILAGDYEEMRRAGNAPAVMGKVPGNADELVQRFLEARKATSGLGAAGGTAAPTAPAAGLGAATTAEVPAAATGASAAAAPAAAAAPVTYDTNSKTTAQSERNVAFSGGPAAENAKKVSNLYVDRVVPAASVARDSQKYLIELASNLSEATKGTNINTPGAAFDARAQVVNVGNTFARSMGLGENYFGKGDSIAQINQKISALLANAGNPETLGAIQMLRQTVANPNMSLDSYGTLAADLLVTNKRFLDRDQHRILYGKDSNGFYSQAEADFERLNPTDKYKREAAALKQMILERPDLWKKFSAGEVPAEDINKAFKQGFGLDNMSVYFRGGI